MLVINDYQVHVNTRSLDFIQPSLQVQLRKLSRTGSISIGLMLRKSSISLDLCALGADMSIPGPETTNKIQINRDVPD